MSEIKLELRERNEAIAMAYTKGYQQGRADAISEFKQMALMVDYHYDFDNLTHEQKQELTDFTSNQVIKVIEMISNYMLEDHDADPEI